MAKKKLFISKSQDELGELVDFCNQNQWELIAHSFLTFESLKQELSSNFEVIFFGSKRAVNYFFTQHTLNKNVKIACVGESTANEVNKFGYCVDFIGQSGNIVEVQKAFKSWLGNKQILFIQAADSNRSFSSILNPNQYIEYPIYQTKITPEVIEEADIYVFTSPSNVTGFIQKNQILKEKVVIAWGSTTKNYLDIKKINTSLTLEKSTLSALINHLSTSYSH